MWIVPDADFNAEWFPEHVHADSVPELCFHTIT